MKNVMIPLFATAILSGGLLVGCDDTTGTTKTETQTKTVRTTDADANRPVVTTPDTNRAADNVKDGLNDAADATKRAAEKTGDALQNAADKTKDALTPDHTDKVEVKTETKTTPAQ